MITCIKRKNSGLVEKVVTMDQTKVAKKSFESNKECKKSGKAHTKIAERCKG